MEKRALERVFPLVYNWVMEHHFSIDEALRFGWHKTRQHSSLVFKIVLTLLAVQVAIALVQKVLAGTAIGLLAYLVLLALSILLGIGSTRVALLLAQGSPARYQDLMPPLRLIWPYIAASILTALCVVGGLILLVIPGFWIALRLSMARFEIIDGAGIGESLRKSWQLTRGHIWHLLALVFVLVLINIIGAILLMVGLLITIPVSLFSYAHVYLKLKNKA